MAEPEDYQEVPDTSRTISTYQDVLGEIAFTIKTADGTQKSIAIDLNLHSEMTIK